MSKFRDYQPDPPDPADLSLIETGSPDEIKERFGSLDEACRRYLASGRVGRPEIWRGAEELGWIDLLAMRRSQERPT